jgi:GT2 family glycosyltransferase
LISVVICSVDAAKFDAVRASYARAFGGEPYEIVGIHDARSLCEGYNRAMRSARGDLCVFSHDDVEILATDLGARLRRHLAAYDVVGVAGTTRLVGMGWANSGIEHARGMVTHVIDGEYVMRLFGAAQPVSDAIVALDGVFLAVRRAVADAIGFDERTFDGWHGYDTDFTFRCHLAGYRLAVALDLPLVHFSNANVDRAWLEFDARFAAKHAGRLAQGQGRWLEVTRRARSRDDVLAAYGDIETLRAVTAEAARRVA